jgi:hypothetical protein
MNNEILAAMIREQGLEELVADMHPDGVLLATGIILSALDTMREAQRAMRPEAVPIQRYTLDQFPDGDQMAVQMTTTVDGEWVKYEDIASRLPQPSEWEAEQVERQMQDEASNAAPQKGDA